MPKLLAIFCLTVATLLSACGSDNNSASNGAPSPAKQALVPSDPNLADLYNSSCRTCHSSGYARAPKTGDAKDWEDRVAAGMDSMLDNAINGIGGMPPSGTCTDCTEEDLIGLIEFMVTPAP